MRCCLLRFTYLRYNIRARPTEDYNGVIKAKKYKNNDKTERKVRGNSKNRPVKSDSNTHFATCRSLTGLLF